MRRWWLWWSVGIGAAVLLLGAATRALEARRLRTALDQARHEIDRQLYRSARARLKRLSGWGLDRGEAEFLLGLCERELGRPDAAMAAWARVPPRSAFAMSAAVELADLAMRRGQLTLAEQILVPLQNAPGPQAIEVRRHLIALFWVQGRLDEATALLEANWRSLGRQGQLGSDQALELLRTHITLSVDPSALVGVEDILKEAWKRNPDDDRIWLGMANLALRTGRFEMAAARLDACLRRRPDDPAAWHARLEWALATGDRDAVRSALSHLPAGRFPPGRLPWLRAWLAARRGDAAAERAALEGIVAADPGALAAWERLAVLAIEASRPADAARFRRRKAELDGVKQRYLQLYRDNNLAADAAEMARLAMTLGYSFEAIGFATWVVDHEPTHRAARHILEQLAATRERPSPAGLSLSQLLSDELAADPTPSPSLSTPPAIPTPPAPLLFADDARAAHLDFQFESGKSLTYLLPTVMSGGLALLDFDGDGWLDLFALQGGPFPPDPIRPHASDHLFRNRRDGTFEDVTIASGLAALPGGYGHGVAVGDYDNDGYPDLFLTRWRRYALYHNRGDGTLEDVTVQAELAGDRDWPTSAAFADLDNDGDLDLYVCHYVIWDEKSPLVCPRPSGAGFVSCDPRKFAASPDHLFRNDGGRFVDVTTESGILDRDGRGLGVVAADLDSDGRVDLFVANDGTANFLLRNLGGLRFEEMAHASGVASNAGGGYQAGMGVACGDFDGDGRPDLAVANFQGESTSFFHNLGGGLFADHTAMIGLAAPSRYLLGFGIAWLDADNDGWLDLLTANGHVSDYGPGVAFAMPLQLLRGEAGVRLIDVSARAGAPFQAPHLGRGLAAGDLDNDGRIDAVVVAQDEPLIYLHNRTAQAGHFLTLSLEGRGASRDAIGARVVVEAGGRRQVAVRCGGGSYQSAGDPRLHFGLGGADRVRRVDVLWPSGRVDRFEDLEVDRGYRLREGAREAVPCTGWDRRR